MARISTKPWRIWMVVAGFLVSLSVVCQTNAATAAERSTGTWTAGGALGFLGNTPDGTAFALNFDAGVFLAPSLSVGPLLQVALTDDLEQVGLSGQGKLWIDIPTTGNRGKLTLQGGLGFVHADRFDSDTSFLIPLGAGLHYQLNKAFAVYTDFFLNFTDLDTERGDDDDTIIMPGLTFGARF